MVLTIIGLILSCSGSLIIALSINFKTRSELFKEGEKYYIPTTRKTLYSTIGIWLLIFGFPFQILGLFLN